MLPARSCPSHLYTGVGALPRYQNTCNVAACIGSYVPTTAAAHSSLADCRYLDDMTPERVDALGISNLVAAAQQYLGRPQVGGAGGAVARPWPLPFEEAARPCSWVAMHGQGGRSRACHSLASAAHRLVPLSQLSDSNRRRLQASTKEVLSMRSAEDLAVWQRLDDVIMVSGLRARA